MSYNDKLANRIREKLADIPNMEEKAMMGGLTFMYNDKMCIGIIKDQMMCRIDPDIHDEVIERQGCRLMDFTSRPMKGFVLIDETGMKSEEGFEFWVKLALAFNAKAKASKKKK